MKKYITLFLMLFTLTSCIAEPKLDTPTNFVYENDEVKWDQVYGSKGYIVYINNQEFSIENNSFSVKTYNDGTYTLKVKAYNDKGYSSLSNDFPFIINRIELTLPSIPTNLVYEVDEVMWDEVYNAEGYTVYFNNQEFNVKTNSFKLNAYTEGTYTIKVKAYNRLGFSSYCEDFIFTLTRDVPTNLNITNAILTWDEVNNASSYLILIDEVEVNVNQNQYDLSSLNANRLFEIKVKTIFEQSQSIYSKTIYYHTYQTINTLNQEFSIDIDENIELPYEGNLQVILFQGKILETKNYYSENNLLVIKSEYLNKLNDGTYKMEVITSLGATIINLAVYAKPTILSSNKVTYNHQDLEFSFQIYNGKIDGLSDNLTSNDYKIDGDKLTIYASYIDKVVSTKPQTNLVIVAYTLTNGLHIVIGFIFIDIK